MMMLRNQWNKNTTPKLFIAGVITLLLGTPLSLAQDAHSGLAPEVLAQAEEEAPNARNFYQCDLEIREILSSIYTARNADLRWLAASSVMTDTAIFRALDPVLTLQKELREMNKSAQENDETTDLPPPPENFCQSIEMRFRLSEQKVFLEHVHKKVQKKVETLEGLEEPTLEQISQLVELEELAAQLKSATEKLGSIEKIYSALEEEKFPKVERNPNATYSPLGAALARKIEALAEQYAKESAESDTTDATEIPKPD